MADYNHTLNQPKNDIPMRANQAKREPGMLEGWYEQDLYRQIR